MQIRKHGGKNARGIVVGPRRKRNPSERPNRHKNPTSGKGCPNRWWGHAR